MHRQTRCCNVMWSFGGVIVVQWQGLGYKYIFGTGCISLLSGCGWLEPHRDGGG